MATAEPPFRPGDRIVVKSPPILHPWPGDGPWVVAKCVGPGPWWSVYIAGYERVGGFNYSMPASKFVRVKA